MATIRSNSSDPACLTVLTAAEQKILGSSWSRDTLLTGLPTVRSVVNAVVMRVYELSDSANILDKDKPLRDDHWVHFRGGAEIVLGEPYPVHALISVENVETANDVADYLNKVFSLDRSRYPKKDGWTAMAAHSRSSIPLDKNHPFFRYKETGVLDSRCCRFLVVSEMATEGMNNRYLAVWGAAELISSVRKAVQRCGRPMRSVVVFDGSRIIVPPASHDRVYIITHEAFQSQPNFRGIRSSTAQTIREALDFIKDMHHATAGLMTLDEYFANDEIEFDGGDLSRKSHLSHWVKFNILKEIGRSMNNGRRPQVARLVRLFGGTSNLKRDHVRAFAESARDLKRAFRKVIQDGRVEQREVDAIEELKNKILSRFPPDSIQVLEAERLKRVEFDANGASAWLQTFAWGNTFSHLRHVVGEAEWVAAVNGLHGTVDGRFDRHEFDVRQTPAARLTCLADEIVRQIELGPDGERRTRELVLQGAQHYLPSLAIKSLRDLDEGSPLCKPEITFELRTEQFVGQLQAWICFVLLREGFLDDIFAVLRFDRFWEGDNDPGPGRPGGSTTSATLANSK